MSQIVDPQKPFKAPIEDFICLEHTEQLDRHGTCPRCHTTPAEIAWCDTPNPTPHRIFERDASKPPGKMEVMWSVYHIDDNSHDDLAYSPQPVFADGIKPTVRPIVDKPARSKAKGQDSDIKPTVATPSSPKRTRKVERLHGDEIALTDAERAGLSPKLLAMPRTRADAIKAGLTVYFPYVNGSAFLRTCAYRHISAWRIYGTCVECKAIAKARHRKSKRAERKFDEGYVGMMPKVRHARLKAANEHDKAEGSVRAEAIRYHKAGALKRAAGMSTRGDYHRHELETGDRQSRADAILEKNFLSRI